MTHDECVAALKHYPRRVLALATVAHVADRCVERCAEESLLAVVWALDATRRWALGETEMDEVRAAADSAADSADSAAAYAAYAAYAASASAYAYAAYAAYAASASAYAYAAAYADADADASASRQALVNSLRDAPTVEVDYVTTTTGHLVGRTHVWLREGACGGRWHRREQLAPEQLVALDTQLEAA